MQKLIVAILLASLFEGILTYSARIVDPFTFTLDQFLSDITFEILPYPNYPSYPNYPPYPCSYPPYPLNPLIDPYPCGYYPDYPYCPIEFEMTIPPCPTCLDFPCGLDYNYPMCGCFRDIRDPCIICDNPSPLCICFECNNSPPPFIYFPPVEYPMTTMDIKPYYYGNCWSI